MDSQSKINFVFMQFKIMLHEVKILYCFNYNHGTTILKNLIIQYKIQLLDPEGT